ncbi:hypothetical protein HOQ61_gp146 [Synechococcus phage ACG-2014f_Syn7803C7]|uniref:Uncharacterized protein n=1 Tax=Synechococcus phage ACG-2014f_Syn7803C7 TaxID=2790345 RepID=A0A0E3F0N5_9CAUD|nr:hypothetical protein HOQ61_gp146 [Synechococcus phage ACG-2014f_Syn7803C7]AIX20037.1 hypothetical protein Syn7803C7_146 [Synechococcus phage ACG-2014f_Syn7803C7]
MTWVRPKQEYRFGLSEKTVVKTLAVVGVSSTVATTITGLHFVLDGFKPRSGLDQIIGLVLCFGVFWLAAKAFYPAMDITAKVLTKGDKENIHKGNRL